MLRNLSFGVAWLVLTLARISGADFLVTTTNDAGAGSYRQAIDDANNNPGLDRIVFNIPGDCVQTIRPLDPLPTFTDPILVDGYTQPGSRPNTLSNGINAVLLIQLDGVLLNVPGVGVRLSGGSSTVRGLVINRFSRAVWLDSSSNHVAGCFVGTDPAGMTALGNGNGFYLQRVGVGPLALDTNYLRPSCCQVIGGTDPADRNLISGNDGYAFQIGESDNPFAPPLPPVSDSVVLGNFIGTDLSGNARIPSSLSSTFTVRSAVNFTLGGREPGAGNVIALADRAVHVYEYALDTRVLGNSFGVGVDGHTPLGRTNGLSTILTRATNTLVEGNRVAFGFVGLDGQAATFSRNLLYSNLFAGILSWSPDFSEFNPVTREDMLEVSGKFRGKSNAVYRLEFFANSAPHASGFGEGEFYLGAALLTNGPAGEGTFVVVLPHPGTLRSWISATATGPDGSTSSFALTRVARSSTMLVIHLQPASFVGRPGTNVLLRVSASGAEPITYQWRRNGSDVAGATNAELLLQNLQLGKDGEYTVQITNPLGTLLSAPATVVVLVNPAFVRQPISQTVAPGQWVTLSASVRETATLPLTFAWRSNDLSIASLGPVQETTTYLTVRAGAATASYRVFATNAAVPSGVGSAVAIVSVRADRDQDGIPDEYEVNHHLDPDAAIDADQDSDGDGLSNKQEYLAGTDPQDALSYLRLDHVSLNQGKVFLEFAAVSNRTYTLQLRERFDNTAWRTFTNFPADSRNQSVTIIDPTPSAQRFYRLATPRAP